MFFEKIIKDLEEKNNHDYSAKEITQIADDILNNVDYYTGRCATPIVKIAKEFGFKTYKENLQNGKSGDIRINGETKTYGNEIVKQNKVKVIAKTSTDLENEDKGVLLQRSIL